MEGQPWELGADCPGAFLISAVLLCSFSRLLFVPFEGPSIPGMASESVDEHYASASQYRGPMQARRAQGSDLCARQHLKINILHAWTRRFIEYGEALLIDCSLGRHASFVTKSEGAIEYRSSSKVSNSGKRRFARHCNPKCNKVLTALPKPNLHL